MASRGNWLVNSVEYLPRRSAWPAIQLEIAAGFTAADGLLLPLVAVFLLWTMNRPKLLRQYCNRWLFNVAALVVVGTAAALGLKGLVSPFC